jgi:hypothetical protein
MIKLFLFVSLFFVPLRNINKENMWAHDKIHIHKVHFSHKNLDATLENEFLAILEKNVKCIISIIHGKNIFS